MEDNEMFGGRTCPRCGRRLPLSFKGDVCAVCEEERLFEEVRDYIRTNEVTEFKLAEKFGLTQRKIQKWINEGLIQFSGSDPTKRIKGTLRTMWGSAGFWQLLPVLYANDPPSANIRRTDGCSECGEDEMNCVIFRET